MSNIYSIYWKSYIKSYTKQIFKNYNRIFNSNYPNITNTQPNSLVLYEDKTQIIKYHQGQGGQKISQDTDIFLISNINFDAYLLIKSLKFVAFYTLIPSNILYAVIFDHYDDIILKLFLSSIAMFIPNIIFENIAVTIKYSNKDKCIIVEKMNATGNNYTTISRLNDLRRTNTSFLGRPYFYFKNKSTFEISSAFFCNVKDDTLVDQLFPYNTTKKAHYYDRYNNDIDLTFKQFIKRALLTYFSCVLLYIYIQYRSYQKNKLMKVDPDIDFDFK